MEKKVIFVGSVSYSGSTLLDMMLASGPDGFSFGEVSSLFHPFSPRHINPACGCGDPSCSIWREIKSKGSDTCYEEIFRRYPKVDTIVDSSKDIFWIEEQSSRLRQRGVRVNHVLVWKTPLEIAAAMVKRGRLARWEKEWRSYHKLYFSTIDQWVSVRYTDLATTPAQTLQRLCEAIGLDYYPGKENYWNSTHHTLFGSPSAKIHLYLKDSRAYEDANRELQEIFKNKDLAVSNNGTYRSIYYTKDLDRKLPQAIIKTATCDRELALITQLLEATSVGLDRNETNIKRLINKLKHKPHVLFAKRGVVLVRRVLNRVMIIPSQRSAQATLQS